MSDLKNLPDWNNWILQKKANKAIEELNKAKDISGDEVDSHMLMSELESIEHHISEIKSHLKESEVAPDWVKSKISEAAASLSDIAHFIMGLKR